MESSGMKYRIALVLSLFTLSAGSYANTLCQQKEQDIQKEISYAEKHNNQNRINGLKRALSEVRANCTDSKLRADHQEKLLSRKKRSPNASVICVRQNKKAMRIKLRNASINWPKRKKS